MIWHWRKTNISSKMIADANQKVLETNKASWRVSKHPSAARGEDGRLVVKDCEPTASAISFDSTMWGNNCGISATPLQMWPSLKSLKKVNYRNLIKQLPCHSANCESCWPAGWTIWENKLDPCFQNAGSSRLRPISWDLSLEISGADGSFQKAQHYSSIIMH